MRIIHVLKRPHPILPLILRLFLGGLFLWSGVQKFAHLETFYQLALNYNVLPEPLAYFYAVLLPWLEVFAGAYLILGLFLQFTLGITMALLLSFLVAVSIVLLRGDALSCGCFLGGGPESNVSLDLWLRDLLLLGVAAYLFYVNVNRWSLDSALNSPEDAPAALSKVS